MRNTTFFLRSCNIMKKNKDMYLHIHFSGSICMYGWCSSVPIVRRYVCISIVLCIMYTIHAVANAANSLTIEKHPSNPALAIYLWFYKTTSVIMPLTRGGSGR